MFKLENRVAIITGGAQGIGYCTAEIMCKNGMKVALLDINSEKIAEASKQLNSVGNAEVIGVVCNIADEDSIENAVKSVIDHFDQLDVLINCAGILSSTKISEMQRDEWDKVLSVNLSGTFFAIQKSFPYLQKSKCGRVINISSTAGRMGGIENSMSYTASKGGVCAITKGIARKFAPYNITCNAVCPGPTATDIVQTYSEEELKNLNNNILLGRLGKPEEIASVVCFIASEEASYITGSMIDVNGGFWIG